ncbi:MAG: hypothetical protein RSE91_00125 [Bacilli bacterium]
MNSKESYQKQHFENYKMALYEIIKNNTDMLIEEDIMPQFMTPPLSSMDIVKTKLISIAKRENVIINNDVMTELIENFRLFAKTLFQHIKKDRNAYLKKQIDSIVFQDRTFRINKTILETLTKNLSKNYENKLSNYIQKEILSKIDTLSISETVGISFFQEVSTYLTDIYPKQLFKTLDAKFYHKNTTLMNGLKEQKNRYLFTKKNSYLYK